VEFKRRIRLLGVRVGSLVKAGSEQAQNLTPAKALSSVLTAQEADPLKDLRHEQADLF
jgi:hypothetical protein